MQSATQLKCSRCNGEIRGNRCTKCGSWCFGNNKTEVSSDLEPDGTVLLSNVRSASVSRITTDIFNQIFGSTLVKGKRVPGIVNTSTVLIGGSPGAGKTTLFMQGMSEISLATGRETLYILAEQDRSEIKLLTDRLKKIENCHQIRTAQALDGTVNIAEIVERRKPAAVVLDSLRGFVGRDTSAATEVFKLTKRLAVSNHCPFIILNHVTKEDQIVGSNDDAHDVDTVMTLFPESETGDVRILEVQKNRFGRAFIGQRFIMSESGMLKHGALVLPGQDDEDEED
jgi:predicted ATP-dependent serine protease